VPSREATSDRRPSRSIRIKASWTAAAKNSRCSTGHTASACPRGGLPGAVPFRWPLVGASWRSRVRVGWAPHWPPAFTRWRRCGGRAS
jgi:hypothetical protein